MTHYTWNAKVTIYCILQILQKTNHDYTEQQIPHYELMVGIVNNYNLF